MPPLGLEPTISAGERQQTYSLDRAAAGTGNAISYPLHENSVRCTTVDLNKLHKNIVMDHVYIITEHLHVSGSRYSSGVPYFFF